MILLFMVALILMPVITIQMQMLMMVRVTIVLQSQMLEMINPLILEKL